MSDSKTIPADIPLCGSLKLADGSSWTLAAKDPPCTRIAELLSQIMQLHPTDSTGEKLLILQNCQPANGKLQQVFSADSYEMLSSGNSVVCSFARHETNDIFHLQLMQLSLFFASDAENKGGLLLHGALIAKNGQGILLAGPGDVGKTTASRRVPEPWVCYSDDSSLLVKDTQNRYYVHPWPSWGSFMHNRPGGTWEVQHFVPLQAIFLLRQSDKDHVESLGKGHAVSLLNQVAEQGWWGLPHGFDKETKKKMRLQRFANICEMIKSIPVYMLHVTLDGAFWEEVDKVLH